MDFYTVSVIIFAVILALIFYKDRKNVERQSILFLRKTQRGKATLIKIGQKFPRFWKVVGTIGVVVGFLASAFIVYWLIGNIIKMFTTETITGGLAFVLPAPTASVSATPGLLLVPFWYWIISIGMLILVHEGFHGIMSAMEKIKIKSLGWGALVILPLAFVEPDEEQLAKRKPMTQLRVYAAGSFANFLLGGLCIMILSFGLSGLYISGGVGYQALIKDYPASSVNFTGTIIGIDNDIIKNMQDLDDVLSHIGPNQTITIRTLINETNEQEFILTTVEKPIPEFAPTWMDDFVIGLEGVVPNTIDSVRVSGEDWTSLQLNLGYWQYVKDNYPQLETKANNHIEQINEVLEQTQQPGFIGILGVYDIQELKSEYILFEPVLDFAWGLLFFMFLINVGVGAANLLPIKPLDGGRMWYIVLQKYTPKRADRIMKVVSWCTLILLISIFVLPFIL